jgi:hypothetical protein
MHNEAGFGFFPTNLIEESSVLPHADVLQLRCLEVSFPPIGFALVKAYNESEIFLLILTVD